VSGELSGSVGQGWQRKARSEMDLRLAGLAVDSPVPLRHAGQPPNY